MNESLNISVVEWLASDSKDPFERYTNAELSIVIGSHVVTEVEDFESKTVRKTIRASAGLTAIWLVANWWRLRWEAEPTFPPREDLSWAMSHAMPAIGGGYVWPDVVFKGSDGLQISVNCKRRPIANAEEFSTIRYLNSFNTVIDASAFESTTRAFVETVIARLNSCGIRKSELHDLWDDLHYERANSKASSHRRLEALLGLDPDEDDELISSLSKWSKKYGQQALEEVSASTDKAHIGAIFFHTNDAAQGIRTFAEVPNLNIPVTGSVPWQHGQVAAYALREKWNLGDKPIPDKVLADRMNIPLDKLSEVKPTAPFSFALSGSTEGKVGFILNRPQDHGRRFDTARLIGDQICFDLNDLLRPATSAMTTRQKFQRAFAAEFLCPSKMIRERFLTETSQGQIGNIVYELSTEYNVAEQVIIHHMENRDVLPHGIAKEALLLA